MIRRVLFTALAAALAPNAHAVELYKPGSAADPSVRTAEFLHRDNRNFSALLELGLAARDKDPAQLSSDYRWQLAESYLAFGMRDRAEPLYRSLAATAPNAEQLARARLRLAEFEYQRGYFAEARATLYRVREKLPPKIVVEWQDLMARVLLAEGRFSEAAETLTSLDNARDQTDYMRYNLAVALINDGRAPQGLTVLDRIGRMLPTNVEELALRDRANLSLGWHFLQSQQGGTAKPVFSRVRVEGPFSNRALLGLGWAELAPQGSRVTRVEVADDNPNANNPFTTFSTLGVLLRPGFLEDDVFRRAGMRSFRLRNAKLEEEEALRKALVPWVELISRDPMDPAVQEAWLAIPFSLDRLGAHTQALQFYERAIGKLEESRKRMDQAMVSIRQQRMVETIVRRELNSEAGWEWKLLDLPDAPETYFLQSLLAEHRFQEVLKNYRDLRMLSRNLDAWGQRLDTIERSFTEQSPVGTPGADPLTRAKSAWSAPWGDLKIRLKTDSALAAPGSYRAPPPDASRAAPQLALAESPQRFDGAYERAVSLRSRLGNLRSNVDAALDAQSRLLQTMAITELEGQKKQIEQYLVEARFALARLYDRQRKGELDE